LPKVLNFETQISAVAQKGVVIGGDVVALGRGVTPLHTKGSRHNGLLENFSGKPILGGNGSRVGEGMKIFAYVDPILWIILGISIALTMVIIVVSIWRHRHQLSDGMSDIWLNVLLNISLAIIASFIFYMVVDVSKRAREYSAAAPYISRQIVTLEGDVLAVCREAARASGRELPADWSFNRGEVVDIFNAARVRTPVNMVFPDGRKANLFDYIVDRTRRTNTFLRNLLIFSYLLGGEATAQIAEIQSDNYLMQVQSLLSPPFNAGMSDQTLAFLVDSFVDHYEKINRLKKWVADNHLLTYPW
jgi:hypothetical protein